MTRESAAAKTKRIQAWAKALTAKQAKTALAELVERACEIEELCFWDKCLAPYWDATGDPLVEGQRTWPEDD
jgi:hypothetical protein